MMEDIPELFIRTGETELSTNELEEAKQRVLPEPSYNVTDHATHTLDPADRKRQQE